MGEPGVLLGLGVGTPARRLKQAVVIGAAAGATLEMDRHAGVRACRVFSCELQPDITLPILDVVRAGLEVPVR
jgi:hypothetical protein